MTQETETFEEMVKGAVTQNRKRLMGFGILILMLGVAGMFMSGMMTVSTILLVGIFVLITGAIWMVESFSAPEWKGKLLYLLLSLVYTAGGIVMVLSPAQSAVAFTLFLAAFFLVIGVVRIVAGFKAKDEVSNWGWMVFSGLLEMVLAAMIYAQWPLSGLWVIGMFVSIELIIHGINAIMLSREVKKFQKEMQKHAPIDVKAYDAEAQTAV